MNFLLVIFRNLIMMFRIFWEVFFTTVKLFNRIKFNINSRGIHFKEHVLFIRKENYNDKNHRIQYFLKKCSFQSTKFADFFLIFFGKKDIPDYSRFFLFSIYIKNMHTCIYIYLDIFLKCNFWTLQKISMILIPNSQEKISEKKLPTHMGA